MKRSVKIACTISAVIIIFVGIAFLWPLRYSNLGGKEKFPDYRDDFELIKNYILEISKRYQDDEAIVYVLKYNAEREIVGFTDIPEEVGSAELAALHHMHEMLIYGFTFIKVTESRIDFGSDGPIMVVFSRDGKRPQYFFNGYNPDAYFRTEKLTDEWFFLRLTPGIFFFVP